MEGSHDWRTAGGIALWLLIAALLYAPFLSHPFQYDDEHAIVANVALRQTGVWQAAFAGTMPASGEVLSGHYRPLTYLTYWVTLRLAGPSPGAFHAVNLVVHLLTAGVLLVLVQALVGDRRVAVLAAALFALHPALSEAVLYASARATLLSSLFMLAALASYVQARKRLGAGHTAGPWWVAWSVCGLFALLSKETAVVLPLLCVAIDHVLDNRDKPRSVLARWAPHLAAVGATIGFVGWLGIWRHLAAGMAEPGGITRYFGVVAGQISAIGMAIRLFVLPWPLTADHPLPVWPEPGALFLLSLVGMWCLMGVIGFASSSPGRRAGFFALWVVIAALPTTLWPLNVPFQEHRAYFQHAGLAALTALGVIVLLDARVVRRTAAALVGAVALVSGAWLIVQQGRTWSDPIQLWDRARATAPGSFRAHTNAGLALAAAGRWDEADAALTSALALKSDYPPALVARGVMEQRRGRREAARTEYERAVALRPDYVPALYNLGLLAQESNDPATAETWYRRALAINPLHADSLLNLGVLLLMRERTDEADAVFAAARGASPGSPEVLFYSGVVAERRGRVALAQEYFLEAWRVASASGRPALAADAHTRLNALASRSRAP